MKKFILLFVCALSLASCSLDDDVPVHDQKLAKLTEVNLPEFFVKDSTYKIDVVYVLPDGCHIPVGITAHRGAQAGEGRSDIYLAGVVSKEIGTTTCSEPAQDLEIEDDFSIRIDVTDPYTFYLYTGLDSEGKPTYTIVQVPVVAPSRTEKLEEAF